MKHDFLFKDTYVFDDLVRIMSILRSENGCPWDREQDHRSIRNDFIEETYEAIEAIDNNDKEALQEELGDVLLQVVFHAEIAASEKDFNIDDVADGICKKLIYRHPHVFGDVKVENSSQVLDNWADLKKIEKHQQTPKDELEAVAKSLPSLIKGQKLIKRAEKSGLSSPDKDVSVKKIAEISAALSVENGSEEKKKLMGELLMHVCALGRCTKTDCEESLYEACERFIRQDGQIR